MRARLENRGLEGLPLKLLITAVVMAISSPIIYGGLRAYEASKLEMQAESEAAAVAELAKLVYIGGPGNAQRVDVNLNGGVTASVDYLIFGDSPGGVYESCVRLHVKGLAEKVVLIENPHVSMRGSNATAMAIGEGAHKLILECKANASGPFVEIRHIDQSANI